MIKILLLLIPILTFNLNIFAQKPEFRGVWIATVDNIDWPSRGNWDSDKQKDEFIKILESHKKAGINAIVAQIRPATDAFYPSQYEPWSQWLTGQQGKPPVPYYDPLEFMITECHKRNMEFHAWMNPYRAVFNVKTTKTSPSHITRIHPEWFLTYGDKRYFDPGNKNAQEFVVNVVKDVVSRYEVDGIHFDDYFYPYKLGKKQFPDNNSFKKHGNGMLRDDWRRSNTDSIIKKLFFAIKTINPECKFGISPFGVWRNYDQDSTGSLTLAGTTNYDDLYADIVLWLKNGWIDYVAPQLYWEFGHKTVPYEILIDWWSKNSYGKHCYIGLGYYRYKDNASYKNNTQIIDQINLSRVTKNVQGVIFFSSKDVINNPYGLTDILTNDLFKTPVTTPAMNWLEK